MAKAIRVSVGQGGNNGLPQDVMTVQYLLNCVPTGKGGPPVELVIDGISGPRTMAAIRTFQTRQMLPPDGRIDPGGPTLARLQQFDPYPDQPLPLGAGFPKSHAGEKQQSFGDKHYKQGFGDKHHEQSFGDKHYKQGFGPYGDKSGFGDKSYKQGFGSPGQKAGFKTPFGIKDPGGFKSGW